MFAVFKREFKSYFQCVIGWLFVAALLALYGLYFYVYNLMQGYPYIYYTLSAITIIFLITVPILTMRSFAEDRKNKTDQLMLTAPVSLGKLVFGKYLAMVAVFTIDIAIIAITPLILSIFGTVPMGESYISIFAFWLYGCASIAVGMFISALTESQVIAAVLSFVVLFVSYMMKGITGIISSDGNVLTKIMNCFDIYSPFEKFAGGCLDITAVVYYLTVIALLNFLTVQSIQKRRWSISKKTFSTGVFSVSFIAVAMALTVVVNLVVNTIPTDKTSIDCSYSKLYSITKATKKAVKKLDADVTIYALVSESKKDAQIDEVLKRYEDLSNHIKVKYVNPSKKPYFYKDYTDTAPNTNSLVVVSDQRSKVIDYYDIYHYETNMDSSTYSYTNDLVGFDAEGQLTSAIEYVTMDSDKLPIVYQITGHDETTVGSAFEDAIKKANMTLSSIELLNEESVPEDASAIIINAPQKDFNEKDAQKVIDYLKDGGKAIIVGSYTENKLPNFDKILDTYKVSITDGVISENDAQHYYQTGGPLYILPEVNSSSSSRRFAAHMRPRAKGRMQTYAIANRSRKISAGVSELAIRTFVETNVAPHTVTVNNAARWYLYSVYFIIRLQKYGFFCAGALLFTFHLSLFTLFFYLCVLLCVMTIITTNNNNYFSLKCKVKVLLNSLRSCWLSRVFISSRLRSRRVA